MYISHMAVSSVNCEYGTYCADAFRLILSEYKNILLKKFHILTKDQKEKYSLDEDFQQNNYLS